jgi:demethylmenaquinone methyltransferase/2-methoxy-6-polyprenyl-1,4-benzoquinol methylase
VTRRGAAALRRAISTPEGKRRYVQRLFATIADRYDFITIFLSYGQDSRWKRRLIDLAGIGPGERTLDLACGTGDLLVAAASRARYAVGVDITWRMLEHAARRASESLSGRTGSLEPAGAALLAGDMMPLPFHGSRFDVVTAGYGIRNVPRIEPALREIHRVLVTGGRFLALDFNKPPHPLVRTVYLWYLTIVGSVLGLILHRDPDTYRYIPESIRQYPGAEGVARLMVDAGFSDVRVVPLLGGLMAIHIAMKR